MSITKSILHQTLKNYKTTYKQWQEWPTHYKPFHKLSLFSDSKTWEKKLTDSCLGITKGSFDEAKICELVGLYIHSKLEKILPKSNFGLYWDNGLALLRNLNGKQIDNDRKNMIRVFKDIGFSLEIETNLKKVHFLDVLFNLCKIVLMFLTKTQTIGVFTFIVYQTTQQTS